MYHCLCTPLPQNASTRSADIPAVTAVCIQGVGRGCHEHRSSQSCPPTPVQPTQAHHMPGRKALCGLDLSAQGNQLLPRGHTQARDGCRHLYPKPAIQPQSSSLLTWDKSPGFPQSLLTPLKANTSESRKAQWEQNPTVHSSSA